MRRSYGNKKTTQDHSFVLVSTKSASPIFHTFSRTKTLVSRSQQQRALNARCFNLWSLLSPSLLHALALYISRPNLLVSKNVTQPKRYTSVYFFALFLSLSLLSLHPLASFPVVSSILTAERTSSRLRIFLFVQFI